MCLKWKSMFDPKKKTKKKKKKVGLTCTAYPDALCHGDLLFGAIRRFAAA